MATSNTTDVFREAMGKRMAGMYTEPSLVAGRVVVLVLDDGTGIAFGTGNGSYWSISKEEIGRRVRQRREELEQVERDLCDVMTAEGALL